MIEGHYTSTNLWAILGLRYSIRLAQELGRTDVLADWKALEKQYSSNILKAIEASVLTFYLEFNFADVMPQMNVRQDSSLFAFYVYIALLALVLLGLDYWLRKKYIWK